MPTGSSHDTCVWASFSLKRFFDRPKHNSTESMSYRYCLDWIFKKLFRASLKAEEILDSLNRSSLRTAIFRGFLFFFSGVHKRGQQIFVFLFSRNHRQYRLSLFPGQPSAYSIPFPPAWILGSFGQKAHHGRS